MFLDMNLLASDTVYEHPSSPAPYQPIAQLSPDLYGDQGACIHAKCCCHVVDEILGLVSPKSL